MDAILICSHMALDVPADETVIYCRRCQDSRNILYLIKDWTVKCHECPLTRRYGGNQIQARSAATRHMLKKGHRVESFMVDAPSTIQQHVPSTGEGLF